MLRRVILVRTDVSEGLSASIIRVTRIGVCIYSQYASVAISSSYHPLPINNSKTYVTGTNYDDKFHEILFTFK
jgi:hypothetical protein